MVQASVYLDVFTSVDDGVGPVWIEPADGEERVTLREQILLILSTML